MMSFDRVCARQSVPTTFESGPYRHPSLSLVCLRDIGDKCMNILPGDDLQFARVRLDHNRQAISDNFLNKVEEKEGRLQTVVFQKIPDVNQTLGIAEKDYLALGAPSRNNPGNVGT